MEGGGGSHSPAGSIAFLVNGVTHVSMVKEKFDASCCGSCVRMKSHIHSGKTLAFFNISLAPQVV